jgi:hypothetical protein
MTVCLVYRTRNNTDNTLPLSKGGILLWFHASKRLLTETAAHDQREAGKNVHL